MKHLRLGLTTGDHDGIGLEVASKALNLWTPPPNVSVLVLLFRDAQNADIKYLHRNHDCEPHWQKFLQENEIRPGLRIVDIPSTTPPVQWVEDCASLCLSGALDGLITGPLSKTSIIAAGRSDMGHTGILKRLTCHEDLFMGFVGEHFNVALVTDHIPLAEVASHLTTERIIKTSLEVEKVCQRTGDSRPIAVLGLNPHAGEEGLLGCEEKKTISTAIAALKDQLPHRKFEGPLVPDATFSLVHRSKYAFFVCMYHDQGLIPFKMIHGQESGAHITLGLPFVRTSVDHGTAKDIAGQGIATPQSMLQAIDWGIRLNQI